MSIENIIDELSSYSIEELRDLNDEVVAEIKAKKKRKKRRKMKEFEEGDEVIVKGKDGDFDGEIVEKKRTRVVVRDRDGMEYDVPVLLLERM